MSEQILWRIRSGRLDCSEVGATIDEAFVSAVKRHKPEALGFLVEFAKHDECPDLEDETKTYLALTEKMIPEEGIIVWEE